MKKQLALLLVGVMAVGMLAGCGSSSSSSSSSGGDASSTEASAESGDKTTITITYRYDGTATVEDGALYKWFQNAYDTWELKDQVELNIAPITASEGDYFTKIALQLGDPSTCPSIVCEDTFQLPNDASAGYLTDLSEYVANYSEWDQYYESMQNVTSVDGVVYGIPYCTDTRGLFYNRSVLETAGVIAEGEDWAPTSWADILDACAKIKETQPDVVPFWCNSGKATGEATSMQTYEMLLFGTGEELMSDGKWVVDSEGIRSSLQFLKDIYDNGYGAPLDIILTGTGSTTGEQQYIPEGKCGILLDGIWITGPWKSDGVAPWENYETEVGLAAMPTSEGQDPGTVTMTGGWALSIPENAGDKDIAFQFIEHAMSPEVYLTSILNQGNICTRKDIGEMEEYAAQPFFQQATEFLETADFRPQNDQYSSVSTGIQSMVESVVSGVSIDDAVAQYAADTEAVVGADAITTLN